MLHNKVISILPKDFFEIVQSPTLVPWNVSRHACGTQVTQILIVITSKPSNFEQRDVIRETWGNSPVVKSGKIAVIFMLGSLSYYSNIQDAVKVKK